MIAVDKNSFDRIMEDIRENVRHQTDMMKQDAKKMQHNECKQRLRMIRFCREKING